MTLYRIAIMERKVTQSGKDSMDVSSDRVGTSDTADILQAFSASASMHGLSKISSVRFTPVRLIWVVATLACTIALIWQIHQQIYIFNQHNTKTVLTVDYSSIQFPDVTLCNHRHIDVDILHSLYSQYHLDQGSVNPMILYQMTNLLRARPELETEFMKQQSDYVKTVHYYQNNFKKFSRIISQAFSRMIFWSVLNVTYTGENSIAAPVEELIAVCNWGDRSCGNKNREVRDIYFRKCLTLKPPENNRIQEGIENGLSVISLVGSGMLPVSDIIKNYTVYIPSLSEDDHPLQGAEGLRVVVHPHNTPSLPMSEGFTIPPGYMGSLGIKVNRYKRMKAPYGNCIDTDPYNKNSLGKYRMAVCLQRCIQNHTVDICNCSNPTIRVGMDLRSHSSCGDFHPVPDNCQGLNPEVRCLSPFETLSQNMNCTRKAKKDVQDQHDIMKYCGCYPACNEDDYSIGFSLGAWPSLMETDIIWRTQLGPKMKHLSSTLNYTDTKKKLFGDYFTDSNRYKAMQDFVKLNVYLSDAAVQKTTEEPDYLFINLVADIGGTMGLWVGMSILSLMEFVQLLLDIVASVCYRNQKNIK